MASADVSSYSTLFRHSQQTIKPSPKYSSRRLNKPLSMLTLTPATILVFSSTLLVVSALRTTVPDEIVEIVRNKSYNKHHLPSQAETMSLRGSFSRLLGDEETWGLLIDFDPAKERSTINLIEKRATKKWKKVSFGFKAAALFNQQLQVMHNHYIDFGFAMDARSPELHILKTVTIVDDSSHRYDLSLNLGTTGVTLSVIETKNGKTNQVDIPVGFFSVLMESINDLLTRLAVATKEYATNVTIGVYIEGMSSFRAESMDFHIDIYFSETWTDPRLRHSADNPALVKDFDLYENMWHPDLYFANAKEARYHTVTSPNFLVWIYPNGTVYLDTRVSMVVNCMMNLANYPLDAQECYIRILSYAYDIVNLNISWRGDLPITMNPEITLPDMTLVASKATYCDGSYTVGTWACVMAVFKCKREIMHHVLQTYIPSALIVIISWFSFWLDIDAVPGRVSLCITTLLTLATQSSAARLTLPQVSYAKAIDVWMGVCMAFVFGVMIEFTSVNYISRRSLNMLKRKMNDKKNNIMHESEEEDDAECSSPKGIRFFGSRFANRMRKPTVTYAERVVMTRQGEPIPEFHNLLLETSQQSSPRHVLRSGDSESGSEAKLIKSNMIKTRKIGFENLDPANAYEAKRTSNRRIAVKVDRVCRVAFPTVFLIFNLIYWPYYIMAVSNQKFIIDEW